MPFARLSTCVGVCHDGHSLSCSCDVDCHSARRRHGSNLHWGHQTFIKQKGSSSGAWNVARSSAAPAVFVQTQVLISGTYLVGESRQSSNSTMKGPGNVT